ncbi:MAG: GyrI-like domain-containing protein [Promethearchaeota archaeon]
MHKVLGKGKKISDIFLLSTRGPVFESKEEMDVVGFELIGDLETMDIPKLRENFSKNSDKIKNRIPFFSIGVLISNYNEKNDKYIFGNAVRKLEDIPENMISIHLSAQKYAIFTHVGKLATLNKTLKYIKEKWLPGNPKYTHNGEPWVEYYDNRFDPKSDNSEFDIWIPVEEN